jgi:hypothetical protein
MVDDLKKIGYTGAGVNMLKKQNMVVSVKVYPEKYI